MSRARGGVGASEPPLDREVGNQKNLYEPRPRIVAAEDCFHIAIPQRTEIRSDIGISAEHCSDRCRNIRRHADPPNTRLRPAVWNGQAKLIGIKHVAEVNTSRRTQGVVPPRTRVDVEQLELVIAGIKFVLQFCESVVICRSEEALRVFFQDRNIDSFYVGTRSAELERVLTAAAYNHFPDGLSTAKECTVRELLRSSARNQLLNHHFAGPNQLERLQEERFQLCMRIGSPGLGFCGIEKVFLYRRLNCKWWVEAIQFSQAVEHSPDSD